MSESNRAVVTTPPQPWLGSATIHEAIGGRGALPPAIKPLDRAMRVWGPAFPVPGMPGDNLALQHGLALAPAGSVLVVDAKGYAEAGPFGEVLAVSAKARELAGLVIYGAVRDSLEIIDLGFPVFSVGLCIRGTTKLHSCPLPQTVTIGGVRIAAGDLVVGDADGVVVVPAEEAVEAVELSRGRVAKEEAITERLRAGETSIEAFGLPAPVSAG